MTELIRTSSILPSCLFRKGRQRNGVWCGEFLLLLGYCLGVLKTGFCCGALVPWRVEGTVTKALRVKMNPGWCEKE